MGASPSDGTGGGRAGSLPPSAPSIAAEPPVHPKVCHPRWLSATPALVTGGCCWAGGLSAVLLSSPFSCPSSLCKGRTLYSVVRDAKIVLDVNKTRQIAQEIVKVRRAGGRWWHHGAPPCACQHPAKLAQHPQHLLGPKHGAGRDPCSSQGIQGHHAGTHGWSWVLLAHPRNQ